jgi:Family of unknown function (DUF5715)
LTELAVRPPRPRGPILQALVAAAGVALVVAGVVALRPEPSHGASPHPRRAVETTGPKRAFAAATAAAVARAHVSSTLSQAAARGLDRGLFTSCPGGIVATAARVARWRPLVVRAARGSGFSPNVLEALVFVESSGRPDVMAGSDVSGAVGLTQIVAATGTHFLHLRVDTARSRVLSRRIHRSELRGSMVRARQLRRWRSRYDERFAPLKSLRATVRYLRAGRRYLGRNDLAVVSYHMGIGNLQHVLAAYGGEGTSSYAQLYFGSAPDAHPQAWRRLTSLADMSRDYYWKVLAAERVMRLYRNDRAALAYESRLQAQKSSAEEVLHPRYRTLRFRTPAAIATAWRHHVLKPIPRNARKTHIAVSRFIGEEAHLLGRSRRLYRGLRAPALDVLLYIGKRVHELSGARRPLLVTSAVRDNRYQRVLIRVNANAARTYSLHTTGYAFDIGRSYAGHRQAAAFQFVLERLQAANAIAYIREALAIHIAVASDASRKLRLLNRADRP